MPDSIPTCHQCHEAMERGHVPDMAYGKVLQSRWARGQPVRQRFFGGIKWTARDQIPITAFRCPKCGRVELYALTIESDPRGT